MKRETFIKRSLFPVLADELYAWHLRPGAFQRLTPPWENVEMKEQRTPGEGSRTSFTLKAGPARITWTAEHRDFIEGRQFRDIQVRGPFSSWQHTHRFIPEGDSSCVLEDEILYRLKLHPLSRFFLGTFVRRKLERMFDFRHRVISADVACGHHEPLDIAVTGAGGLIGTHLVPYLTTQGHRIVRLARCGTAGLDGPAPGMRQAFFDCCFDHADAVIHLAGEPIGEGTWTDRKKKEVMESRVEGTRFLAEYLAALPEPPSTLICASAIGYYGDRGDELLAEDDAPGTDFISGVCRAWEQAAQPAVERGIRVVFLRIGVVLHPRGGALRRYLAPARLGLGGVLGTGRQFISWISMEDLVRSVYHILFTGEISGPVNIAAPEPARNRDFVRTLARVLGRPALLTLPKRLVLVAYGRMGRELLLSSTRVSSKKLAASGFRFMHEKLEDAFHYLLGR